MEEEVKVNFSRPMMVLKIREVYKAPYHKNKYITIKKTDFTNQQDLKKYIQQYTANWSSGTYDIQYVQKEGTYMQPAIYATFCRIEVQNGKVSKLHKYSPFSRKIYPCWQYFKDKRKKKIVKKRGQKLPKKTKKKKASSVSSQKRVKSKVSKRKKRR